MPRPDQGSATYRAVLALPHARRLFLAAMLGRLCYGLMGLPLLLALRADAGSYALAGTATGLAGLVTALLGPVRARLVERHRAALPVLAVVYAALLGALALACAVRLAPVLTACLAVLAGVFPPPVGPLMRTLWGRLVADEGQLQCALSLDTAAESTVFALGPVLGGYLVVAIGAPAALAVVAAVVLVGFGLLTQALRGAELTIVVKRGERRRNPLRGTGIGSAAVLVLGAAAGLSMVEVGVVAAWGTVVAGVLAMLFSVGGVLGGLLYGRRRWRGALQYRPLVLGAAGAAGYLLPALLHAPALAGAALLLAGACCDVLLVTAYQLVDARVPEGSRTEAGAWINTAYNLGAAFGAAVGGVVVDRVGPFAVYPVTAGLLVVCLALSGVAVTRRRVVALIQ
ncbi:MFS transporter [Kitasatospora sp. NPDC002227]|uniref:MFS transporter n=1 Tax=Kitasatospora sp. NPDC002227 TaxID=3154773 RepID=UPI00331A2607